MSSIAVAHTQDSEADSLSAGGDHLREFRILIASDIHLGYQDRSSERRLDSLNAFEELLQVGLKKDVHFVLFAGDLFHVNDPPKWVVKESIRLLRKYCFGDRDIDFRLTSDQSRNFADSDVPVVNYEDPNINVSLPVFTIHGNHDDPVGVQHESVVKLLSTAGLLNYFGRVSDFTNIELEPLLFERARTKVAVYGLGAIRDERLNTLFREGRVHFRWPEASERWFKILVVHQNRVKRGPGNYLPESFLPSELDLVIWGHEHECLIKQQFNGHFHVIQPGSTVATSLCPGEVADKHVGVLHIQYHKPDRMTKFDVEPIRLLSVRQLFVEDVLLSEMPPGPGTKLDRTVQFLQDKIEDLVEAAVSKRTGHPKQPPKPLIRLRVLYGPEHETFLPHLVGRHFKDKIANPSDCLHFVRDRTLWVSDRSGAQVDEEKFMDAIEEQKKTHAKIEDMINIYFKSTTEDCTRLHVIHEDAFTRAIQLSVEKGNPKDLVRKLIESSRLRMCARLDSCTEEGEPDEASMLQLITERKLENNNDLDTDVRSIIKELDSMPGSLKAEPRIDDTDGDDDNKSNSKLPAASGRGRGRGRGRGSRGGTTASRVKQEPVSIIEDDSDDDVDFPVDDARTPSIKANNQRATSAGRGRGRGASSSKSSAKTAKADAVAVCHDSDSSDDAFSSFIAGTKSVGAQSKTQGGGPSQAGRQAKIDSFAVPAAKRGAQKRPPSSPDQDDLALSSSVGLSASIIGSSLPPPSSSAGAGQASQGARSQRSPATKKSRKQNASSLFDGFD